MRVGGTGSWGPQGAAREKWREISTAGLWGGAWVEEGGKDRHRREIEAEVGEKGCSEFSVESSLAGAGVSANSSSGPPVLAR